MLNGPLARASVFCLRETLCTGLVGLYQGRHVLAEFVGRFPTVLFRAVAFPRYQVLELFTNVPAIQDSVNFVVILSV